MEIWRFEKRIALSEKKPPLPGIIGTGAGMVIICVSCLVATIVDGGGFKALIARSAILIKTMIRIFITSHNHIEL